MTSNNIICQLSDGDGSVVGGQLDLPQTAGPAELELLINQLLQQEERVPYIFYIDDVALEGPIREHLLQHKKSVESVLRIVCQPQAVFRIRPVTRCSATIPGHSEAVLCVAFSPDGRQLASGSGDTTVRLWDVNTQTPLATLTGHRNWVLCVAWSPDCRHLVSGGMEGDLFLWNTAKQHVARHGAGAKRKNSGGESNGSSQELGCALKGHRKWITSIAWEPAHLSHPSRRFVSGSRDGDLRVWDVVRRGSERVLSGHTLAVTCVKWGGDGCVYSGSRDCSIRVWDPNTGQVLKELKGHGHWVNSLALSSEHALRTAAFDHKGRGGELQEEEFKEAALARFTSLKGSPQAMERLVSGSDDFTMILWNPAESTKPVARLTGHVQLVNHVAFSPDGRWIASASFDKSVKLWDGSTGRFIATLRGHVGPIYQISWSADSRLLVSASKDSTLKVWEVRTKKMKEELPGHADEVFAVDWSPDGQKVASGGKDRVLKLWMS